MPATRPTEGEQERMTTDDVEDPFDRAVAREEEARAREERRQAHNAPSRGVIFKATWKVWCSLF